MVLALGPDFTVDNLVSSVQLRCVLPSTPTLYTTTNIIQLLDEEMRTGIIPLVKTLKEEYWVTNYDYPIVAGVQTYAIPYRAALTALRDVVLVDNLDNELKLVRYEPEDIKFPLIPTGSPYFALGYYLKANNVVLFPPTAAQYTTYSVRMKYERRPNNLISMGNAGQVVTINTGTNQVTLSYVPTSWTANVTTVDIINNVPPFDSVGDDIQVTGKSGLTLTLSSLPDDLAVNFWVAPSMQTPIAQIPYEAFPILSQRGVVRVMSGLGDSAALTEATKALEKMEDGFRSVATPRVEGTPKTLSNRGGVFDLGRQTMGGF